MLSWLAAAVDEELVTQVAGAAVVGECSCGCSSVQLFTLAAPPPAATTSRLSSTGRADVVAVSSSGRNSDGHVICLVLHVVEGRPHELEVFDTDAGEGAAVDLAGVTGLSRPDVG